MNARFDLDLFIVAQSLAKYCTCVVRYRITDNKLWDVYYCELIHTSLL